MGLEGIFIVHSYLGHTSQAGFKRLEYSGWKRETRNGWNCMPGLRTLLFGW